MPCGVRQFVIFGNFLRQGLKRIEPGKKGGMGRFGCREHFNDILGVVKQRAREKTNGRNCANRKVMIDQSRKEKILEFQLMEGTYLSMIALEQPTSVLRSLV